MCLHTKQDKPTVANKDIIVYKILTRTLKSPYSVTPIIYKFGKVFETEFDPDEPFDDCYFDDEHHEAFSELDDYERFKLKTINKGIHSALTIRRLSSHRGNSKIIVKATIPKGTKYYLGLTNLVVSEKIRIDEICQ